MEKESDGEEGENTVSTNANEISRSTRIAEQQDDDAAAVRDREFAAKIVITGGIVPETSVGVGESSEGDDRLVETARQLQQMNVAGDASSVSAAESDREDHDEASATGSENEGVTESAETNNVVSGAPTSPADSPTNDARTAAVSPERVYPGAEAVRGPEYKEGDDDAGTIVIGDGEEQEQIPVAAHVVNVDSEEDLRRQIRELQERLRNAEAEVVTAVRQDLKTILWVDDNPGSIAFEANFLTERGFHVTQCESTGEARNLLQAQTFDVIISDVHRFEDGREYHDAGYRLLRSPEVQADDTPVIFYLGNVSYLDREQAQGAFGAADNEGDLLNLVMRALLPFS